MALIRADFAEELIVSIIRATKFGDLGTTISVTTTEAR
jgi:hypothetical protein